MSKLNELKDELISSFKNLDEYKTYLKLKEKINSDEQLNNLQKEIKLKKEELKKLSGNQKKQCLLELNNLNKQYNDNPYVVNYNSIKSTLIEILSPLIDLEL